MQMNFKFFKSTLAVLIAIAVLFLASLPLVTVQYSVVHASTVKRHSDRVLHVKFAETDDVTLSDGQFTSTSGKNLKSANAILNNRLVAKKNRLFSESPESIQAKRSELLAKNVGYIPRLNNYYRIVLNNSVNIDKVINDLKTLPEISEAYAEPMPAMAPVSPSFTSQQSHFGVAPAGMGITNAASYPGALGDAVRIADLEYSWNTAHEDLSDARQTTTLINNGTPSDPFSDKNHGTAAIGLLNGDRNTYGINGIVSNAQLHLTNTNSVETGWNIPNAINVASSKLSAGDVMLIEQQTWGLENRGYLPVEWVPAVYDAIRVATSSGIIVVEPAANGSENLDDPVYGSSFPQGKPDSGAIIVGAGAACNGTTQHNRLAFSNYGKRVNLQGHGECVVTSGYGNLYSSSGENAWYTNNYNGTSSASALVAGVAASVSSSHEVQKGAILTPLQIRQLLASTGTTQYTSINPGNIGPLPNLENAIRSFSTTTTDTTAPTAPTNLTASLSSTSVNLAWRASTDNSGSVSYRIYRNSILIATTTNLNYTDSSVARRTSYSYKVQAIDPSGNVSTFSNSVSIKTK